MSKITEPFPLFLDTNGQPLENGQIFVGLPNQDPRANPIQLYWDEALTIPAQQPIRTLGGRPAFQGAPANVFADAVTYSIVVLNKRGALVTTTPETAELTSGDVSFIQSGTGAVLRTAQSKERDRFDVRDFGVDLTGVADSTTEMQNAVDEAAAAGAVLYVPAGTIRLTAPIEVPAGGVIEGVSGLYMADTFSGRTIFHIDHTGRGFTCTGADGGRAFRHLSTLRNQDDNFIMGWAPEALDWDFATSGATDVSFDDILLINATKGIGHLDGGGRFTHNRVWGQPLEVGIQVDVALDVVRSSQIHFWNFWSAGKTGEEFVFEYMTQNATAYYSKRNDNPDIKGLFNIFYRHGLRIGNFPMLGTTQRMRVFGIGCDACGSGITVDADANGATVDLYGFYAAGYDQGGTSASLINIEGTNGDVRIYGRTDLSKAERSAIRVVGSGAALTVNDVKIREYNGENGGYAAIEVDAAAFGLTVRGETSIVNGPFGSIQYSGTKINTKAFRSYTPSVAPNSGAFGAPAVVNSAVYNVIDGVCTAIFDISFPDNGTGAGNIQIGLPLASAAGLIQIGYGREIATSGVSLVGQVGSGGSLFGVATYVNAYPVVTGSRIIASISYRV